MKKIFTLIAAVLTSFSLWAVEPTFESYDWAEADIATVAGDHDGVVISYAGLGDAGNVSGHWYIPNNQNLKNSDSDWKYFGVSASSKIDSISILYCPNGGNYTNIAWVAWGQDVEPNQYVLAHGMTTGTTSSKSWDNAIWETIDLSEVDAYTVYTSRSVREFREIGASSNLSNFGGGQTINILGIRVYLNDGTPAVTYTATYKANNGTAEADIVDDAAKKVAACTFTAPEGTKFAGWNTAADGTGTAYEVGAKLESDVTLYAQWAAVCYESIYDLVEGIGSAEVTATDATVNEGVSLVLTNSSGTITLTPAEGYSFQAGDIIEMSGTIGNTSKNWGVKIGSQTLQVPGTDCQLSGVLAAGGETISIKRADGTTTTITSLVIKRETVCKEIQSTLVELTDVKINGVSLEASQLAALKENNTLALETEYVVAPTIVFVATTTVTYVDETTKVTSENLEVVAEENAEEKWEASQIVNVNTYTITAVKPNSFTITYKDGETVLGEEVVKVGEDAAKQADYEAKQLATFLGWFTDAELTLAVESWTVTANRVVYGKWEDAYATSYNFEKAVMENGKAYDFLSQLGAQHYATNITGSLDSLDNSKSDKLRNYAYLGLKVKQSGALLNFRLAAGKTVKVKFGEIKSANPHVSINGGDYAEMEIAEKVYEHTAATDELISIKTMNGDAVVFQQIAIDEDLQAPELFTITCAEAEHGTVSAPYKLGIPGEEFKLSFTMDEGYAVASCYANDVEIVGIPNVGEFFTMPAENVTITATFADAATAIDNTNAETKAAKVIRNGQLIIVRDGVEFNAQGAIVK